MLLTNNRKYIFVNIKLKSLSTFSTFKKKTDLLGEYESKLSKKVTFSALCTFIRAFTLYRRSTEQHHLPTYNYITYIGMYNKTIYVY